MSNSYKNSMNNMKKGSEEKMNYIVHETYYIPKDDRMCCCCCIN